MTIDKIIDKNLEEFFWDIYNSRINYLRNNDEEYMKLQAKIMKIIDIEELRSFFSQDEAKNLSEDAAIMLLEYIHTLEERHVCELKELFYSTFSAANIINEKLNLKKGDNS